MANPPYGAEHKGKTVKASGESSQAAYQAAAPPVERNLVPYQASTQRQATPSNPSSSTTPRRTPVSSNTNAPPTSVTKEGTRREASPTSQSNTFNNTVSPDINPNINVNPTFSPNFASTINNNYNPGSQPPSTSQINQAQGTNPAPRPPLSTTGAPVSSTLSAPLPPTDRAQIPHSTSASAIPVSDAERAQASNNTNNQGHSLIFNIHNNPYPSNPNLPVPHENRRSNDQSSNGSRSGQDAFSLAPTAVPGEGFGLDARPSSRPLPYKHNGNGHSYSFFCCGPPKGSWRAWWKSPWGITTTITILLVIGGVIAVGILVPRANNKSPAFLFPDEDKWYQIINRIGTTKRALRADDGDINSITVANPAANPEQYWQFIIADTNGTDSNGLVYYLNNQVFGKHKLAANESQPEELHIDTQIYGRDSVGVWYWASQDGVSARLKNEALGGEWTLGYDGRMEARMKRQELSDTLWRLEEVGGKHDS